MVYEISSPADLEVGGQRRVAPSTLEASPVAGRRIVAPYITAWSEEPNILSTVVERPGVGIAYPDEQLSDRDERGVLWSRVPWRPDTGTPNFGTVHSVRQRRAMRRLLCQVCAGPTDRTDDGVLWLLKDHRDDWPGWPNRMGVTEPPVCRACVALSVRVCPALRRGAAVVRAGSFPVVGVTGTAYRMWKGAPVPAEDVMVEFTDPQVRWVQAANLIRRLNDCVLIPLDTITE